VYDCEAYPDKTKRYSPTADLTYENTHVSVGDTMVSQPTHICNVDPKALIASFIDELNRRATVLRTDMEKRFIPADIELLTKKQQQRIRDWCRVLKQHQYTLQRPCRCVKVDVPSHVALVQCNHPVAQYARELKRQPISEPRLVKRNGVRENFKIQSNRLPNAAAIRLGCRYGVTRANPNFCSVFRLDAVVCRILSFIIGQPEVLVL